MSDGPQRSDLYERSPAGLLSASPSGVITRVNQTLLDWTGFASEDLVGTPFTELLVSGSQIFYETRYLQVLRLSGELREAALTLRRREGPPLAVLLNSRVVGDSGDILMAVFDATERQDYERQLLAAQRVAEASEARVRVLQEASSAFGAADTEQALAEALVTSAREALAASAVAVVFADDSGHSWLAAGEHVLAGFTALPVAADELAHIRTAGVVTVSNVDEAAGRYPALAEAMMKARVEAFTIVPLYRDETPIGALICYFGRQRSFDEPEIELQVAVARQAAQVLSRIRLQAELQALALRDQLTGLASRVLLREHLSGALAHSVRTGTPMSLVFLDLDGFKAVNDNLGHYVGDAVLKWVAGQVSSVVRGGDVVGRFGGDEFIVICQEADQNSARSIAERIVAAVRGPSELLPGEYSISASVGIAVYHPGADAAPAPDVVFVAADQAMYRSKSAGGDRVTVVEL